MTDLLGTLEFFGSILVFGQCWMTWLSVKQLLLDKRVAGMSIATMAFYSFASFFYIPIFLLGGMIWTMVAVAILGLLEAWWCVLAVIYRQRTNS